MMNVLIEIFPDFKNKLKTHVVAIHTLDDLLRLGSLLDVNTEKFEQVNGLGKQAYTQGNKKSPSKDIALAESRRLCCQFLQAGGTWLCHGKYVVGVGKNVAKFLALPLFSTTTSSRPVKPQKKSATAQNNMADLDSTWDVYGSSFISSFFCLFPSLILSFFPFSLIPTRNLLEVAFSRFTGNPPPHFSGFRTFLRLYVRGSSKRSRFLTFEERSKQPARLSVFSQILTLCVPCHRRHKASWCVSEGSCCYVSSDRVCAPRRSQETRR